MFLINSHLNHDKMGGRINLSVYFIGIPENKIYQIVDIILKP